MPDPTVSIIIVTYNSKEDLKECLPSVLNQDYPAFEVIIVDNHSEDGTVEFVERYSPQIQSISNNENLGCAQANNIGINATKAKYVVILNPDTVVAQRWLSELVRVMEEDESVGACQSRVLLYNQPDIINTEGNDVHYLGFTWCRNYGQLATNNTEIEETLGLSNCACILRREALEKVGQIVELYVMYLEDTELGIRLYQAGYKVVVNPNSVVYHKYRFSRGEHKVFYLERNRLLLLLGIYNKFTLLKILPAFIFMEAGLIIVSVFQGWFRIKLVSYASIIRGWRVIKQQRRRMPKDKKAQLKMLSMMSPEITFEEISNPILNKFVNPVLRIYYHLIIRPKSKIKHNCIR